MFIFIDSFFKFQNQQELHAALVEIKNTQEKILQQLKFLQQDTISYSM